MAEENVNFLNNFSQQINLTQVFQSFNSDHPNNSTISVVKDEQNQKDVWMIDGQLREDGQKKVGEIQSDEEEGNINTENKNGSLKSNPNQNVSEFLPQYLNSLYRKNLNNLEEAINFNQELQSDIKFLQQVNDKITRNGQFQKCQQFTEEILIHSIQPTKHYEIVVAWLQCGWYKTKIVILNNSSAQMEKSPLHYSASISSFGSFGNLYFIKNQNQNYAVKCICTDQHVDYEKNIQMRAKLLVGAFREYFFLKLFSELEIGPKVKNCFGFDMMVFADCIEFSMEICTRIDQNPKIEQKLIDNLKTMSLLQIIHRDIKPDNIMWSDSFKKPVFIDFGQTIFIKESVGIKKATSFVGTIGFVSEEMIKIFTDKKGMADLYYNDLYGLKESLKLSVKFEGQEEMSQSNEHQLYQVKSSQFLMFFIKHKLFTRQYSEFSSLWLLIKKFYFFQQQAVQQRLLQFILDLRPNKFLIKIYWTLKEEVREMAMFDDVKNIFSGEESYPQAIWTKVPLKEQKFKNQALLYRLIARKYQKISSIQRKITTILESRERIDHYLVNINQNYETQLAQEQKVITYCVVLSYYCMIGYGKFGIEIEKKVQVASQAIEILQQLKSCENQSSKTKTQFNFMSLFFVCRLQNLKPIGLFFQYFMFKLWPKIPERFKDECLRITVSSLSLLGYPFYLKEAKHLFMYFMFKKESSEELGTIDGVRQKLVNILLFWKVTALIRVYGEVFYHRSKSNFLFPSQKIQSIMIQVDDYISRLMTPSSDINFTIFNHNFYQNFQKIRAIKYSNQHIRSIMLQLKNEHYLMIPHINWIKYYREWQQNILFLFNIIPGQEILPLQVEIMDEFKPSAIYLGEDINLTIHFSSFLKYCKNTWNMERLGKMFTVINQKFNYQSISERFLLSFRLFFAWKMKDISTLKKLCTIIYEETSQFSVENLAYLSETVMIIYRILLLQRECFWNFIIEKLISFDHLFKILKRSQSYILHYLQKENLLFAKQDPISTFKNLPSLLQKKDVNQTSLPQMPQIQERLYLVDEVTVVYLKLNDSEQKLFRIFYHVLRALGLLSEIYRFSLIFMKKGLTENSNKLMHKPETIDIVTHLRTTLPEKLKKSLFLSLQTQSQLQNFITYSKKLLQSPSLPLSKFYNAEWNIDNKVLLQVPLEGCNDFSNLPQIFERNYGKNFDSSKQLQNKNPSNNNNQNPSLRLTSMHILSKMTANKQRNIQDYEELISCYNMWKNQNILYRIMLESNMIKYLCNGFIYCQKPYSEFLQFLLTITEVLNTINQKFAVEVFRDSIKHKFVCKCEDCFPLSPKNWKPLEFIEYVYSQMSSFNETSHPYMSIVLMAAILNKFLSFKIKRKFFSFIHKAMEHLNPTARNYIFANLYYEAFLIKAIQKGIYVPGKYTIDYKQMKEQIQIKYDRRIIYMEFYYASKFFKLQFRRMDIKLIVEERFRQKRRRIPKWRIPLFVQNLYRKKLHKYHFIFEGSSDQVLEFQLNMDLIKQLQ